MDGAAFWNAAPVSFVKDEGLYRELSQIIYGIVLKEIFICRIMVVETAGRDTGGLYERIWNKYSRFT